jgi:phosphatidate cytidylyltransferase
MYLVFDGDLTRVVSGVAVALSTATAVGRTLRRHAIGEARQAAMANLTARITAWWVMCAICVVSVVIGRAGFVILFALVSFLALRELLTLAPTRRADHRALAAAFWVAVPVQYSLIASGNGAAFTMLLPIGAALAIPLIVALGGDTTRYVERASGIQWALLVCVYCVSHAPALLMLDIPGYAGQNAKLVVFLIVVVEVSDVLQYIAGKLLGRRPLAPTLSPNKTVEGLVGGIAGATALGGALWWLTPFTPPQAAALSLAITLAGCAGGLVMSAVKRDRGVKDFGTTIAGHGGILDRIDSLAFAAPVFFHLTRAFFAR